MTDERLPVPAGSERKKQRTNENTRLRLIQSYILIPCHSISIKFIYIVIQVFFYFISMHLQLHLRDTPCADKINIQYILHKGCL